MSNVDTAASTGDTVVQEAVSAAETVAETAIIAAYPAMGTPVWKQIWEGTLNLFCGKIGWALGTITGYVIMDVQKYIALTNAAQALAQLQAAQKSGNSNAITQANTNADAAVAPILHYIGSVTPNG